MAEILSPNAKQRGPFSPVKSPFFIGSNDDKLERAQARAARAAAIRRKPAFLNTSTSTAADPCLGKEQILDLFQNCIKLASENVRFSILYFTFLSMFCFSWVFSNYMFRVCRKLIRKIPGSWIWLIISATLLRSKKKMIPKPIFKRYICIIFFQGVNKCTFSMCILYFKQLIY